MKKSRPSDEGRLRALKNRCFFKAKGRSPEICGVSGQRPEVKCAPSLPIEKAFLRSFVNALSRPSHGGRLAVCQGSTGARESSDLPRQCVPDGERRGGGAPALGDLWVEACAASSAAFPHQPVTCPHISSTAASRLASSRSTVSGMMGIRSFSRHQRRISGSPKSPQLGLVAWRRSVSSKGMS